MKRNRTPILAYLLLGAIIGACLCSIVAHLS